MFKPCLALILLALLTGFAACKKSNDAPAPVTPGDNQPRIFDAGTPIGTALKFTVTNLGGTFSSPDKNLSIIIPAGALPANTEISIQPVTNTNPAATGPCYRLLPHGLKFIKPVTIEMAYNASIADPVNIGIFYQNTAGEWRYIIDQNRNAAAKTITVSTTHFSDWTIGQWIHLKPQSSSIATGESQELKLVSYFDLEGDLAPLNNPGAIDIAIGNERAVNPPFFKTGSWKLIGKGNLTTDGSKATYTAPSQIDAPFQATVSVEISDPASPQEQHILIGTIDVDAPGKAGVYFSVNGGPERYMEASIIPDIRPGYLLLTGFEGNDGIELNFRNAVGAHSWDKEEIDNDGYNLVQSMLRDQENSYQLSAYYDVLGDGKYTNSSGSLTITKAAGKPGDVAEGSFIAGKCARVVNGATSYTSITGHFKGTLE